MLNGRELIQPVLVPSPHPASIDEDDLRTQCRLTRGRTTGPGGQHRNKVATQVTLTHTPTGLSAQAGERRSPAENERVAMRRLRVVLAVSCRAPVPLGEIGSSLWRSRLRGGTIVLNHAHRDYPSMLAEALDVIHAGGLDLHRAGLRLGCTPSQLLKLIAAEPHALDALNRARVAKGEHPLKR